MIEQVFVSGQIAKAVYEHNDRYYVMGVGDFREPVECRAGDVSLLFDSRPEVFVISGSEIDLTEIGTILEFETQAHRALSMTLGGLDDDLSSESRLLSVEAAEELLQDDRVQFFVRARMLARTLPNVADIDGAMRYAEFAGAHRTGSIYKEVSESQRAIEAVLSAWNETAKAVFDSIEVEAEGEKALIEKGVFSGMVAALTSGDFNRLNSLVVTYGRNPELTRAIPRAVHLINAMRAQLLDKAGSRAESAATVHVDQGASNALAIEGAEDSDLEPSDAISDLIARFDKRRNWKPSRGYEVEDKIKNQIESIGRLIRTNDLDRAYTFLVDLIEFHLEHSEKEHVAMSLCSLAKIALDSHSFDIAELLVEYAFVLRVEDAVISNTQAEILKTRGRLAEAVNVYEETINRFPDNVVARSGYAEVLKDMGQFEAALKVYEESMTRFPDDVFARSGCAEVLKDMGRFEAALKVYEESMTRFPDDVVVRNGYAEVLKDMARFEEALKVYEESMTRFPDDVFARSGYAEVLKAMGRFGAALKVYEEAMTRFPDDVVTRNGYASLLVLSGDFADVRSFLSYLSEGELVSRDHWIGYHILAMAYLRQGHIEEAIRRLDFGWRSSQWIDTRSYFATALGVARINQRAFAEALEPLTENLVSLDVFQRQKRLALIGHSQAASGKTSEAASSLSEIEYATNPHVISLKDAVIRRFSIGQERPAALSDIEIADLETKIDEEAFRLGMVA